MQCCQCSLNSCYGLPNSSKLRLDNAKETGMYIMYNNNNITILNLKQCLK